MARVSWRVANRQRRRSTIALAVVLAVVSALLAACGGSSGKPVLTWYINPDPSEPANFQGAFGQAGIAERCSTDAYTIQTQSLPGDASQQRIQLARRLAAQDQGIDLMSLDPVFTGEFANAGFLATIPDSEARQLESDALKGAARAATWNNKLVVAPLWANTQLLWYRKSFAKKAGLDMSKPVTWNQIIDAASNNGGTVGVQANKYEGYVVWINALIAGAGGNIITDPAKGVDAPIDIGSEAGKKAAAVIEHLASSKAAEPDLSVSNEGTVLGPFATPQGAFQVNWTFVYPTTKGASATAFKDLGWARYPETVAGKPSRPPVGGINLGIGAYSSHVDLALQAAKCITSEKSEIQYAGQTGNMPALGAAYSTAALKKLFPTPLLNLFRESLKAGGPRPNSPYWSDISQALQNKWHPPSAVTASTPASSSSYIDQVLHGKALL
jgi:multiple sugar transport system substrate-binding protein